jgi:hypothetical protein
MMLCYEAVFDWRVNLAVVSTDYFAILVY